MQRGLSAIAEHLVKLEMLIRLVPSSSCYRKKL